MSNRACQFLPFNGLRGFTDLLDEAEKPQVVRKEITEERADKLNNLIGTLKRGCYIRIIYYTSAGYVTQEEEVEEINPYLHYIRTHNGCISFRDIYDMQILDDR